MSKFIQSREPETVILTPLLDRPYQWECPRCGAIQPTDLTETVSCNACAKEAKVSNFLELVSEYHKDCHIQLHKSLDILIADFISHTGKHLLTTNLMELMKWSYLETINPTEK
jgi:phage terminase large subunit GpA-like protein